MAKALDGMGTLLLVSGHETLTGFRCTARQSGSPSGGVERIVYTSFVGAAPSATFPYARDHGATEDAVREAGISLTSMRDALYADSAPPVRGGGWGDLRSGRTHGRVAWVARADVARLRQCC